MRNSYESKYVMEINDIKNLLNQLEKNRIYEFSQVRNDGTLNYNIVKLRELLNDLLNKIENNLPSREEKIKESFDKFSLDKPSNQIKE